MSTTEKAERRVEWPTWRLYDDLGDEALTWDVSGYEQTVAWWGRTDVVEVPKQVLESLVAQANAAVPASDLLEALKGLRNVVRDDLLPIIQEHGGEVWMAEAVGIEGVFQEVDAAIAKAEGADR